MGGRTFICDPSDCCLQQSQKNISIKHLVNVTKKTGNFLCRRKTNLSLAVVELVRVVLSGPEVGGSIPTGVEKSKNSVATGQ